MRAVNFRIVDNGDSALTICFNESIGETLSRKIIALEKTITNVMGEYLLDVVPSYQSITVIFSLLELSKTNAKKKIEQILRTPIEPSNYASRLLEIPVCYGGEFGPDLSYLNKHCGLSENQIIKQHSQKEYLVHMLGFLPGFLYLGGLHETLYCPRKSDPKLRVAKGSVGIGGSQTGIYPVESPGGWQIIGRTPAILFDPNREKTTLASPLDRIKFVPINHAKFLELEQEYAGKRR